MSDTFDFDVPRATAHLDRLAADLLKAESTLSELDLAALAADLATAAHNARQWADARGVPAACIPREPFGELTLEGAARFLTELATALRWLDAQAPSVRSMAEVVQWLRQCSPELSAEIELLTVAVNGTLENLVSLRSIAADLCGALETSADRNAAAEPARQLVWGLGEIGGSVAAIRQGLASWLAADTDAIR